jgi:hypothetical protein
VASGRIRKRIKEVLGWTKAVARLRKTRHRGLARVGWMFTLTATTYNLVRLPKLWWGPRRSHARNLPGPGKNRQNQHKRLLKTRFSATTARVSNENSTKRVAGTAFFRILLAAASLDSRGGDEAGGRSAWSRRPPPFPRGTSGSNPCSSSGESIANLTFGLIRAMHRENVRRHGRGVHWLRYVNAVLPEITSMSGSRERSVVRSSVIPSAKYAALGRR